MLRKQYFTEMTWVRYLLNFHGFMDQTFSRDFTWNYLNIKNKKKKFFSGQRTVNFDGIQSRRLTWQTTMFLSQRKNHIHKVVPTWQAAPLEFLVWHKCLCETFSGYLRLGHVREYERSAIKSHAQWTVFVSETLKKN